jgi:hypothetical protein
MRLQISFLFPKLTKEQQEMIMERSIYNSSQLHLQTIEGPMPMELSRLTRLAFAHAMRGSDL